LDALRNALVLPSGYDICVAAMREVIGPNANNAAWIKESFSRLVEEIQIKAYEMYLEAERPAVVAAFRQVFEPQLGPTPSREDFFNLLRDNFRALDRFFLGLTQGRRPRAGKAFEYVIKVLFDQIGYPYSAQPVINGQPDFLLPSVEHYRTNAMDCIIFTVKRTLRERWRQITTEGTRGHQFFLATIDKNVAARDLPELRQNRIYLVVPESVKAARYPEVPNVLSFETFFRDHLDPAMDRWRANGVID
jgi:hypothetical protein